MYNVIYIHVHVIHIYKYILYILYICIFIHIYNICIYIYIYIYVIVGEDKIHSLYATSSFLQQQASGIHIYLSKSQLVDV